MSKLLKSLCCFLPSRSSTTAASTTTRSVSTTAAAAAAAATTTSTPKPSVTEPKTTPPASTMGSVPTASATETFLGLLESRRSFYPLSKTLPVAESRVQEIVSRALQAVPSSFNSQSNRAVVLFGAAHDKLWSGITTEALRKVVPAEQWEPTGQKMAMFGGAAGTVLFFEDSEPVKKLQEGFPIYADRFPTWATHSSAMLQLAVWTALESEGLGANLQHYNPLIDAQVAEEWKIPSSWTLTAQLVFGGRVEGQEPGEKTFQPVEEKLKVFSA
ncbi:hypothetical protein VTJ83DRAFT_3366 [Remersonia thermophila]|uniref:Nitroreductase domain-containing protein n=1 Tax=Remersonia thermophila TaxID=72144 RepID=A0ABR4DDT6_9PEZI